MKNILSINTSMLDGYNEDIWMRFTGEMGLSHVEFAFNQGYAGQFDDDFFGEKRAQFLTGKLNEYGLKTVAMGCTMDMGDADSVEAFSKRIVFAARLGVTFLNTNTTSVAKKDQFFRNMEKILPVAEKHRCVIALENGGDKNYDLFACAKDGIEIIEKFNSKHLSMNYDAGNLVSLRPDLSPAEDSLVALPYCSHLHLKDVSVHDDRYTFPSIGKGIINYQKILSAVLDREDLIPMSIEKPLRMHRKKDATPVRASERVDLHTIKKTVKASVDFIHACMA